MKCITKEGEICILYREYLSGFSAIKGSEWYCNGETKLYPGKLKRIMDYTYIKDFHTNFLVQSMPNWSLEDISYKKAICQKCTIRFRCDLK